MKWRIADGRIVTLYENVSDGIYGYIRNSYNWTEIRKL